MTRSLRIARALAIGVLTFAIGIILGMLTACASAPSPREPMAWPPAAHPEWQQLDPALCHPWPCHRGDPVEWPGADNLPSGR